jgi:hypothetical protein
VCSPLTVNMQPAPWGICFLDCRDVNNPCPSGSTCNQTSGLCQ